jgi:GNAT superfamily N-acetyltransferase
VVTFRESAVTDTSAHELLTDYFEGRARGFPAGPYAYLRSFPRPEQFVPPDGVFLVAQLDDTDVGCGGIRRIGPDGAGSAEPTLATSTRFEAKHIFIRPQSRGHGLGRALLQELERRARKFGATQLVLDTNSNLDAARGLYLTSGFELIEPYNDNPNATDWYGKRL